MKNGAPQGAAHVRAMLWLEKRSIPVVASPVFDVFEVFRRLNGPQPGA